MKITIIGSGFAALTAVKTIRKQSPEAEILLISVAPELVYLPGLIWIPAGLRSAENLRVDLTRFFRRKNVTHLAATVTGISGNGRTVFTDKGPVANDGLIIASGGRFIRTLPGIEHTITPCSGTDAAVALRDRLNSLTSGTLAFGFTGNPQEPSAMRGGPVFEFLFGIDTLLRRQGRRHLFDLVFFNPAVEPGKRLGKGVPVQLLKMMDDRGIRTYLGHQITGFGPTVVNTGGGDIRADLILFMPGMTGPAWADESPVKKSAGGLIKADEYCRAEGMECTYVAGDSGSFPGPEWQAKQAHMADLQAVAASRNLLAELQGSDKRETFRHELLCIIDMLSQGVLVKRTETRSLLLPPLKLMHYAKRFFEYWYLRQYR